MEKDQLVYADIGMCDISPYGFCVKALFLWAAGHPAVIPYYDFVRFAAERFAIPAEKKIDEKAGRGAGVPAAKKSADAGN